MGKKKKLLGSKLLRENYFNSKFYLIFIQLVGWLASISTFAITIIIGAFFELQFHTSTNRSTLLKNLGVEFSSLNFFFFAFALIILVKISLSFIEKQLINKKAESFIKETTLLLFKKQMFWTKEVFQEKSYGKYLLRYSGDLGSIKNMLVNGIHRATKDLLYLITGIALMLSINSYLTGIIVLTALILSPIIFYLDHIQNPLIIEKRNRKSLLLDLVTRSFSNHEEIGKSNKRNRTVRKFKSRINSVIEANLNYQKLENLRQMIGPTVANLLVFILLFSISQFSFIQISPSELLVYLLILATMTSPIKNIIKAPGIIQKGKISLMKIEQMINKKRTKSSVASSFDGNDKSSNPPVELSLRISKDISV
ncbi:ABC transporter transmembrane domain-containing protein [Shivajiella indica]|uniref:ABC transporter transmembrane domain-containing protein n=1 Tax=Shivajiella indica TaxID=872115 RepID=A0ABW5B7E7_9BACT